MTHFFGGSGGGEADKIGRDILEGKKRQKVNIMQKGVYWSISGDEGAPGPRKMLGFNIFKANFE